VRCAGDAGILHVAGDVVHERAHFKVTVDADLKGVGNLIDLLQIDRQMGVLIV
jgi:hypothetical protein